MSGTVEPSKPDLVLDPIKKRLAHGPLIFFFKFNRSDNVSFVLAVWKKIDDALPKNPKIRPLVWKKKWGSILI